MKTTRTRKKWATYGIYSLLWLTILIIAIRIATGKYNEGYLYILLWTIATIGLPTYIISLKSRYLSDSNWYALFSYFLVIFFSCFLMQPLFWAFGKVGFIPFFSYSLLVFLPFEAVILLQIFRRDLYETPFSEKVSTLDDGYFKETKQKEVDLGERSFEGDTFKDEVVIIAKKNITDNQINDTLKLLLLESKDGGTKKELMLLQQQWIDFEERRRLGMLTDESTRVTMATIVHGILSIIESGTNKK